jgi:hypothetical protein
MLRVLVALLFVVAAEALRGHRRQQPSQWQSDQHRRKARRRRQREEQRRGRGSDYELPPISFAPAWSQLHTTLNASQLEILSYERRVAVIFTGLLRVESADHISLIRKQLGNSSAFISTYERYREVALSIVNQNSSRVIAMSDFEVQEMNATCRQPETWQWNLLSHALREWRHELFDRRRFVAIVRSRTDLGFPQFFSYGLCASVGFFARSHNGGLVYAHSDTFFYARSDKFYAYFEEMWNQSTTLFSEFHISVEDRRTRKYRHFIEVAKGIEFRSCLPPSEYAPHPREQLLQQEQHCTMWSPNRRRSVDGSGKAGQRGIAHRERLQKYVQELQEDGIGSGEGSWWDADATESNEEEEEKEEKEEERNEEERGLTAGEEAEDLPLKNNDMMMNYVKREEARRRDHRRLKAAKNNLKYGHHRVFCGCKVGSLEKDYAPWRRAKGNKRFQSEPAMAYQIITKGGACLPPDLAHREAISVLKNRASFTFGVKNESNGILDELFNNELDGEEEETEESSSSSSSDESENEDGVAGEYTEDGDDGGHENLDDFYVDPRNKMQPPQESGDAEFAAAATRFVATNASDARERRRGEVAYD